MIRDGKRSASVFFLGESLVKRKRRMERCVLRAITVMILLEINVMILMEIIVMILMEIIVMILMEIMMMVMLMVQIIYVVQVTPRAVLHSVREEKEPREGRYRPVILSELRV